MPDRRILTGHLLALFTIFIWGTTFISTKILLEVFHPVEIILLRFSIAWLVLFCLSPKPLLPHSFKEELRFIAAGLTGLTFYFLLENTALSYTLASNVGIIISAAPLFTVLLLWLFHKGHRPKVSFLIGFVTALAGISMLSLAGTDGFSFSALGDLLTICAALSWGGYCVSMAYLRESGYTPLHATRKTFFWGLLFTLPAIPFFEVSVSLSDFSSPVMIGNLLYLGLGASALCYITWNRSMTIIGAAAANVYIYLTPVITMLASALILHETITPSAGLAAVLILMGLWLSQKQR